MEMVGVCNSTWWTDGLLIAHRAFLGQVPFCLLAILSVSAFLHLPKIETSHWKTKLKRVDFLGATVLVSAVFTLLVGLDQGSNISWSSPVTIACMSVTFPLFGLFILVEEKYAAEPFAPARIIFERRCGHSLRMPSTDADGRYQPACILLV